MNHHGSGRVGRRPRRSAPLVCVACGVSVLLSLSAPAVAQTSDQGPLRIPAFGRGIAVGDDTTALVSNPGNLAFLPGAELRWTGVYLDEDARVPWQGHAIAFGFPLPFLRLATALRVDLVKPPAGVPTPPGDAYQYLTWGLSLKASDAAALGFTLQRTYSEDELLHGLASWSVGATTRPWNALSLGGVVHNVNRPVNDDGGFVDRTYEAGFALRPFGSRVAELGGEVRYVDDAMGYWVPRATLAFDLPPIGRVRGDFAILDPLEDTTTREWLASVGLSVNLNSPSGSAEIAGGSVLGSALGDEVETSPANLYSEVATKLYREPVGPEAPRQALRIRLEHTPDSREHVKLLRTLWDAAEREKSTDAVVLELRATPVGGLAEAQELRDAIRHLRLNGKRVLCHIEDGGGSALYVCAAANRVLIAPAGGLRFAGLRSRRFYLAALLDKLGIDADFVRIGAHKSAPEQFERDSASETARADAIDLLQQAERYIVGGIAAGRGLSVEQVRERIRRGPFLAKEAVDAGLADGVAFDDQLDQEVSKLAGRKLSLVEPGDKAVRAPERFGQGRKLAIVHANGSIVDGRSSFIPFIGMQTLGSYSLAETLQEVRNDASIKAVVLRVDSPGGSALASDVIWREVQLTAQRKPVVVSMAGVAASGGYYVSAPATRIFASPLTVTGSIGIFVGKADVSVLMRRIGVNVEVYKTAPRADAESIYRPFTSEEREELERKVAQFYDQFLSRVAEGRKLPKQRVDAVGQGRVWTGEQASTRGLVDELGGLRQAVEYARGVAGLPAHAPIVELPVIKTSLLGRLLGIEGVQAREVGGLPRELAVLVRAMGPLLVYSDDRPLALLELAEVEP